MAALVLRRLLALLPILVLGCSPNALPSSAAPAASAAVMPSMVPPVVSVPG